MIGEHAPIVQGILIAGSHRKNIFRKLGVNNVHESTKYAMRAGIVDLAEYYI